MYKRQLQQLAQDYADRQRQGEFIPNRAKAEYELRFMEFLDNQQRAQERPAEAQEESRIQEEATAEADTTEMPEAVQAALPDKASQRDRFAQDGKEERQTGRQPVEGTEAEANLSLIHI